MKKVLFGSTALVAAAFAGTAFANGVTLSVGGDMVAGVGAGKYADGSNGGGAGNVDKDMHIITDGEIKFHAKGTLDNGITVEVRVELEAISDGAVDDQMDETWVQISSSFGRILIGSNDTALDNIAGGIGRLSSGVGGGSWDGSYEFVPASIDHIGDTGDDPAIHYYTPNISGFQAGISFAPTSGTGGNAEIDTAEDTLNGNDVLSAAASYSNTFGDVDFVVGGGYLQETDDFQTLDHTQWGVGVELGFSGLTIGGRYENDKQDVTATTEDERTRWGGGVMYATGPWEFGANYTQEHLDDDAGVDVDKQRVNFGVAYELGDGVVLGAHADYGDFDSDNNAVDADSWGGALLLGVNF